MFKARIETTDLKGEDLALTLDELAREGARRMLEATRRQPPAAAGARRGEVRRRNLAGKAGFSREEGRRLIQPPIHNIGQ